MLARRRRVSEWLRACKAEGNRIAIGAGKSAAREQRFMVLALSDHETTRPASTQPTTTKLPRFSATSEASWGEASVSSHELMVEVLTSPNVMIVFCDEADLTTRVHVHELLVMSKGEMAGVSSAPTRECCPMISCVTTPLPKYVHVSFSGLRMCTFTGMSRNSRG